MVSIKTQGRRQKPSCLQNLLTVFRHHYEFFGRQPKLSRLMLREMTFYDSGRQADRFHATRERVIRLVSGIIQRTLDRGAIRASETQASSDGSRSASIRSSCAAGSPPGSSTSTKA
jgi:hypothetical protein